MHASDFGSVEFQMLWWSMALGLVQLALAATAGVSARDMRGGLGARDEAGASLGKTGARFERAYRNFLETFPFFAAAVLMAAVLNRHSSMSVLGAQLYFWGRLLYLPIYVLGIPIFRTLDWAVAVVGIVMVFLTIWP